LSCFCCFKFTKKRRLKMAASGRMSTFHERHPISASPGRTPPSQYAWQNERDEPPQEMERISYQHTPKDGKFPSPGLAQGRWSRHTDDDADVPLSAVPRDDIGPAPGQAKDPYLHEQYFGVASSGVPGEGMPGPSGYAHYTPPDQRDSWGR